MSSALIVIEQDGSRGPAGQSRDDIVTGLPVVLSNGNNDGVRSWRWSLLRPKGSTVILTNVVGAQPQFVPDVAGTYVITLTVDQGGVGQVNRVLVAVRNAPVPTIFGPIATRYLGIEEDAEANWTVDLGLGPVTNTTGWWEDLDRWFRVLESVAGGGGLPTIDPWSVVLSNGNTTGPVSPVVDQTSSVVYVYAGGSPMTAGPRLDTTDGASTATYDVPVYFQAAGTPGGGGSILVSTFLQADPGGAEAEAEVFIKVAGRFTVGGVVTNFTLSYEGRLKTDPPFPIVSTYLAAGSLFRFTLTNLAGSLRLNYVDLVAADTVSIHGKISVAAAAK